MGEAPLLKYEGRVIDGASEEGAEIEKFCGGGQSLVQVGSASGKGIGLVATEVYPTRKKQRQSSGGGCRAPAIRLTRVSVAAYVSKTKRDLDSSEMGRDRVPLGRVATGI